MGNLGVFLEGWWSPDQLLGWGFLLFLLVNINHNFIMMGKFFKIFCGGCPNKLFLKYFIQKKISGLGVNDIILSKIMNCYYEEVFSSREGSTFN